MSNNKKNVVKLNPSARPTKQVLSNRSFTETPLNPLDEPPSYMTKEAAEVYRELLAELADRPNTQSTDRYALQVLADSIANYRAVRTLISNSAELIKNKQGNLVTNPARFALNGERSSILGMAVQFKMTPKSRADEKKQDEDDVPVKSINISEDF